MIEFLTIALAALMSVTPMNITSNNQYKSENVSAIFASTNSTIIIKTPNNGDAQGVIVNEGIPTNLVDYYTNFFDYNPQYNLTPTVETPATTTYNSFSYAFYMHWVNNATTCCIYDFGPFLDDHSFIEVNAPQVDDILVYYTYVVQNNVLVAEPIHSGIVRKVYNTSSNGVLGGVNTLEVMSKWGPLGVFTHRGDECPYVEAYNFYDENTGLTFDVAATEVRYYRRHTQHDFTYSYHNNGTGTHIVYCRCGESETVGHIFNTEYANLGNGTHSVKCKCGASRTESHNYYYTKANSTEYHYKNCACGYSEKETHTWTSYIPSLLTAYAHLDDEEDCELQALKPGSYVQCIHCQFVKRLKDDEIVVLPAF